MSDRDSFFNIYSQRYDVRNPWGLTGLPAPPLTPLSNGKNQELLPQSQVHIRILSSSTAKCTAHLLGASSGSLASRSV